MTILNYKLYGVLDHSPPVVMLHGLLGSLDNWNSQAKKLSSYRSVISVDLRNHGDSPHVKGMSYREMAEDIITLLSYLNIKHCYLMGHSMGGKVAMTLALNFPEIVTKLLVVDIAPKAYKPRHLRILQGMSSLPLSEIKTRKEADICLSDWISTSVERGFLLKNLKYSQNGFYWQCDLAEITKNYLKISGFSVKKGSTYLKETLFIVGGQSDYIQPEDSQLIQQYFPVANIQVLKQAGHLPHVEDVDNFYHRMKKFFL